MEYLAPYEPCGDSLCAVERLLHDRVWCREPRDSHGHKERISAAMDVMGVSRAPDAVWAERVCLTHGDPTLCNVGTRDGELVLADPVPPRFYTPEVAGVDRGKILQSAAGWEVVAYGWEPIRYDAPVFWFDDSQRTTALFWCALAASRVIQRELKSPKRRDSVLSWAYELKDACRDAAGF